LQDVENQILINIGCYENPHRFSEKEIRNQVRIWPVLRKGNPQPGADLAGSPERKSATRCGFGWFSGKENPQPGADLAGSPKGEIRNRGADWASSERLLSSFTLGF